MSRISAFGDRGVLVTCEDRDERLLVSTTLASALPEASVRVGPRSVLVVVDRPVGELHAVVRAALESPSEVVVSAPVEPRLVTIDVTYDGADLAEVATWLDMPEDDVVDAHVAQLWVVDVMGFAPGFGYLIPASAPTAEWSHVGRRATPRRAVPSGSVAVAAGMSAVYPTAMPGGWNLLGRTSMTMFDASNPDSPSVLLPGTHVRFAQVTA